MLLGVFKIFIKIIVYKNFILFHKRKVFVLPTGGYLNSYEIITAINPDSTSYSYLMLMLENPRYFMPTPNPLNSLPLFKLWKDTEQVNSLKF